MITRVGVVKLIFPVRLLQCCRYLRTSKYDLGYVPVRRRRRNAQSLVTNYLRLPKSKHIVAGHEHKQNPTREPLLRKATISILKIFKNG